MCVVKERKSSEIDSKRAMSELAIMQGYHLKDPQKLLNYLTPTFSQKKYPQETFTIISKSQREESLEIDESKPILDRLEYEELLNSSFRESFKSYTSALTSSKHLRDLEFDVDKLPKLPNIFKVNHLEEEVPNIPPSRSKVRIAIDDRLKAIKIYGPPIDASFEQTSGMLTDTLGNEYGRTRPDIFIKYQDGYLNGFYPQFTANE